MLTANLLICTLHGGTVIGSLSPGPHHAVLLWWPHRAPSHSHTGYSYFYANIPGGSEFSYAQISKGTVPCSSISWSCLNLDGIVSLPQLAFSLLDKHFVLILFCFTDNDDSDNSLSVLYSASKFLDHFLRHSFIIFFFFIQLDRIIGMYHHHSHFTDQAMTFRDAHAFLSSYS